MEKEYGNIIDIATIDVLIDQERWLFNRIKSKLPSGYSDLEKAFIYWKVHDRIMEESE